MKLLSFSNYFLMTLYSQRFLLQGRNCITHSKEVLDVLGTQLKNSHFFPYFTLRTFLEGKHTREFFENLLQGPAVTYDFKWLRGVYKNAFTGEFQHFFSRFPFP